MTNVSEKLFVGIDVSKATLEVALDSTSKTRTFGNHQEGIAQVVQLLKSCPGPIGVVLLEATGGLEHECAVALCLADAPVIVANPRQAHDFAKAMGHLAKTDALDAKVLSHFGKTLHASGDFEHRLFKMPVLEREELEALVIRRIQLVEMRVAEGNRLARAHKSQRKSIQAMIQMLQRQIDQIDIEIRLKLKEHFTPQLALLKGIKGVGTGTLAALMSMLPELGQLNAREIAKLAGVAPLNRDSGKFKGKRTTWGGRTAVRAALYMAVLSAMRHEPVIKAFYEQLRTRGKSAKVAMVACMHKLLTIMNAIIRSGQPWNPAYAQLVKH
jgi:transposase